MATPFQLDAADEYMHDNTGESNFNESMYFNFFDPTQKLGGFLRIGNRANERYHHELGLSISGLFGFFRVDFAKRLDADGFTVGFGVAKIF